MREKIFSISEFENSDFERTEIDFARHASKLSAKAEF